MKTATRLMAIFKKTPSPVFFLFFRPKEVDIVLRVML